MKILEMGLWIYGKGVTNLKANLPPCGSILNELNPVTET
jgi:hypothetical protein